MTPSIVQEMALDPVAGALASPVEWGLAIVIAVWLTKEALKFIHHVHERKNGVHELYRDPKSGAYMSFEARSLQMLAEIAAAVEAQNAYLRR